jgi:hypothetical protein
MPSPFPGMDPFIESPAHWPDFYARFISELANAINDLLPDQYVARINEHVMSIAPTYRVEGEDDPEFIPDVAVVSAPQSAASIGGENPAGLLAPVMVGNINFFDDYAEGFIQVLRLPEQELVTVIELLSPTNKYGEGRGIYMKKRREFLSQKVNLVELDLIRAGVRLQFDQPLPPGHYRAFISRSDERPRTSVYSWSVREPLPKLPIPLRAGEGAIVVALLTAFGKAYDQGRYPKLIDYRAAPPPPSFSSSDSEWIRQTLSNKVS